MATVAEPKPQPVSTTARVGQQIEQTFERVETTLLGERNNGRMSLLDLTLLATLGGIAATTTWPLALLGLVCVLVLATRMVVRARP